MRLVLKIAYDGTGFAGFQRQPGRLTVQGALESAASNLLNAPVVLQGAGRTDVGVHASGQVVLLTVDRDKEIDVRRFCRGLNSVLREPIAVCEGVLLQHDDPFHPRYSALSRRYAYFILAGCGPREARFWNTRAWCLPQRLDLLAMREATTVFAGEHDFSTFCYKMEQMETRVRRVHHIGVESELLPSLISPDPDLQLLRLTVTANGFLRRMVRLLSAGLVEVGLRQRTLPELRERLALCDPSRAPHPAPAHGLYLEAVDYNPDPFDRYRDSRRHTLTSLAQGHRFKP